MGPIPASRYASPVSADPESDPRVLRARPAGEGPAPADPRRIAAADQRLRVRETLIEKIIREAQAAGQFDDLPFQGERLPAEDDAAAGDMASAFRILRNAGAAPPWIETDREIRRLLGEREALRDRAIRTGPLSRDRVRDQLRALVTRVNRLVVVLNHEAPSPRQHRRPLDLDGEMADLEWRFPA